MSEELDALKRALAAGPIKGREMNVDELIETISKLEPMEIALWTKIEYTKSMRDADAYFWRGRIQGKFKAIQWVKRLKQR